MILPPFRLHRPRTVEEAFQVAASCGEDFDYIGGGTDLLPNYKNRLNPRRNVIALWEIEALREKSERSFGSMIPFARLEEDESLRVAYPGLMEAIQGVATPLVRRQATLGGNLLVETRCYYFNQSHAWRAAVGFCMKAEGDVCLVVPQQDLCYAVYVGDTAAPLMALDASLQIAGVHGRRCVKAREFFVPDGIARNVLQKGEIITRVDLPDGARRYRSGYEKLRLRDSFDFPDAGVAAALLLDGDEVEDLHVVVNAVSMAPLMFPEVTGSARGQRLTAALIGDLARMVADKTQPVRNVMFPPQYRKRMIELFTRRLLSRLAGRDASTS
ncbi:MAG: FAD binding domain-containing protein [Acidobacteriota bacterium]